MRFSKTPITFALASIFGLPLLGGCVYDDDHHHHDNDHVEWRDYNHGEWHHDWDHDHDRD